MLRFIRFELIKIGLRFRTPFETAFGILTERPILLLRSVSEDGIEIWTECPALPLPDYSPETIDTEAIALKNWLLPSLLNLSFDTPDSAYYYLNARCTGHRFAKSALDTAYWILDSHHQKISFAERIGGTKTEVPGGLVIGSSDPKTVSAKVQEGISQGYTRIKVKILPDTAVQTLFAAKSMTGSDVILGADANGAYTNRITPHLPALNELRLDFVEQPAANWIDSVRCQEVLKFPVCLDELILDRHDVTVMNRLNAGRMISLKPARVGGITAALAILDECRRLSTSVWIGGMFDTGIGKAAAIALASRPEITHPGDLVPTMVYWEDDIVTEPATRSDGALFAVNRSEPGLGITINTQAVNRLTTESVTIQ
ncbi:o-succinylbenzoate synthase [bacterium]|nr:o-succinylbenzoate synthase [bacterium]